ncbi:hypothetical protein HPC37_00610 [Pasteurellaceae bacterium 20609_3]|uniref:hypothetical protein n=1 Tax=Spirabiliibacterium mucosae TaxID=28156 RepID=UPI001AACE917|nr:hypothetical protein [Spirabiliibacterium mucosae]MBE2897383.1 hypothetical protein [Spirabiliibacterium mucosae]
MHYKTALCLALGALLISACDNEKTANEANFTKALNDHYANAPGVCINLPYGWYPSIDPQHSNDDTLYYLTLNKVYTAISKDNATPKLEALVAANLLSAKGEAKINVKLPTGNSREPMPVAIYSLTDKGKAALVTTKGGLGEDKQFCSGHWQVAEIVNFTEPAGSEVVRSRVTFKRKLADGQSWLDDANLAKAFPELEKAKQQSEVTKRVELTNKGWQVAR